jgi:transposase
MEITEELSARIKDSLPVQCGHVSLTDLQVLNRYPLCGGQGCKWCGLPKRFGRWHTIYMRMNRWAKNGVLDRVFEKLQLEQIVRIRIEVLSLASTSVKVQPDGTGAPKKDPDDWKIPRWIWNTKIHMGVNACQRAFRPCGACIDILSAPLSRALSSL